MSPQLLAHLLKLQRQTRRHVTLDNRERAALGYGGRITTVRDFYRPLELVRWRWNRPRDWAPTVWMG